MSKSTLHLLCFYVQIIGRDRSHILSLLNLFLDLSTFCRLAEHYIVLLYLVLVNKNFSVINK